MVLRAFSQLKKLRKRKGSILDLSFYVKSLNARVKKIFEFPTNGNFTHIVHHDLIDIFQLYFITILPLTILLVSETIYELDFLMKQALDNLLTTKVYNRPH